MSKVLYERRDDGIAVVRIDGEGKVNLLTESLIDDFEAVLGQIEGDPDLAGCVIASTKAESFLGGADLRLLIDARESSEIEALARRAHAIFNRIERSTRPFVAAVQGPAFGGGMELALACRARVAADDPGTMLALPEVTLGIIPGAGGTQRLPRLIGLRRSLPMLLAGDRLRATQALHAGLVDAVTPPELLLQTAVDLAKEPPPRHRPNLNDRLLAMGPLRRMFLRRVRDGVLKKTRGLYPAPLEILECIEAGYARGFEAGCEEEIRRFSLISVSRAAKNLIGLFLQSSEARKLPKDAIPRKIERMAVLGAGLMGEGIASVSLPLARVLIKDLSAEALERAASSIDASLKKRVAAGSLSQEAAERRRGNLARTTEANDLRGSDLVIEAVYEDLALKQSVLAEAEDVIAPSTVYASNTSAIPIGSIATKARYPERIVGMHYFSPVPKMQLLEIVAPEAAAEWAIRTAQAFGIAQGKSVIVVRDSPGFYTTRILSPYLNEAIALLEEGAGMKEIDDAVEAFGFPVGPLRLVNKVGLKVAAHVARDLAQAFERREFRAPALLLSHAENGAEFKAAEFPGRRRVEPREIVERIVLSMVNEAAHCLGEGVIANERDGDLAAVLGLGFPPFRGGPFRYIEEERRPNVADRLHRLVEAHGARFEPAAYFG